MLDKPANARADVSADGDLVPHSIELEQALLGACLLNEEAVDRVSALVDADDFYEPLHVKIFDAMRRRRDLGGKIDIRLVVAAIGEVADIAVGEMTAGQYVARLAAEATTVVNAPDYARGVRELADRRRIISATLIAAEEAKLGKIDPREVVENAIVDLDAIATSRQAKKQQFWVSDAVSSALASSRALKAGQVPAAVPTGITDLDRALGGGLQDSDLIILAGRPGMGKTTLATIMLAAAGRRGHGGYLASLEMNGEQVGCRLLSSEARRRDNRIPYNLIRAGKITPEEDAVLEDVRNRVRAWPLRIDQEGGLTVAQIAARARIHANRLAARGQSLDIIAVDYLGLVKPSNRYAGKRNDEVTEISGGLKALAKELNVPVLALSQLSRQVESRIDKRPQLSDLRDSGSIEQDADVVLFAYREAYYLEQEGGRKADDPGEQIARLERAQSEIDIIIGKQRMGPCRTVKAFCEIGCNFIGDLAQREML